MSFSASLIAWQQRHGRHDLPWQGSRDPYRVWLSEVMLQQTQVAAAIPYYERFVQRYPCVQALAAASEDEVLRLWSGLGYYARGRNLLRAAREVVKQGRFPDTVQGICALPGVGRSTAAAIAVFAFGRRAAILDGNVKRVLSRCYGVEDPRRLWPLAERLLPRGDVETYTQALMDLGATICLRKPRCGACPVSRRCVARKQGRTAELPAPRARKALPLRRATWFVYLRRGKVLLERRPSPGLWGGLWTFPERRVLAGRAGSRLARIEHGFTHFRLRAQPVLCRPAGPAGEAPRCRWMDIAEATRGAVPTPVRKLLQRLLQASTA